MTQQNCLWKLKMLVASYLCFRRKANTSLNVNFLAIWLKENSGAGFDFVRAAKVLDKKNRELISEWINDPIWP